MSNIFLISDTHFNHGNILSFTDNCGARLREFDSVQEMDETMVHRWNSVVRPGDKVYHLGDVAMNKKGLPILERLNGEKILIKGNHDKEKLSEYMKYFKDVRGSHQFDGILMTHIPVHPNSLGRWPLNVHGHLHSNQVTRDYHKMSGIVQEPDPRYLCVSVEQINYTPISLEEMKVLVAKRKELFC